MPVYATMFLIIAMSSLGLPTLNGFIGEFVILQGTFEANRIWAAIGTLGIVLGAAYLLWLYQRTMFGTLDNPKNKTLKDINFREAMTLVPLIIWAFWIGLYPKPYFDILEKPVQKIVQRVRPDYYAKGEYTPPPAAVPEPRAAESGSPAE
jgi:NADH-quinone oxidoreductase subunit M